MSLNHHAHATLLILATVFSASSPASANSPPALTDTPLHRLPHIPDLPPWLLSPSTARNKDKAVPVQTYPGHSAETEDENPLLPATAAEDSKARRALTERELETLPRNVAEPAFPSMAHGLRTLSSQWFHDTATTETVPPALLSVAEAADDIDLTSGLHVLNCTWLDGACTNAVGVLGFAVIAAGTIIMLGLLWRRHLKARRRARREGLGLRFVRREEKAGLL